MPQFKLCDRRIKSADRSNLVFAGKCLLPALSLLLASCGYDSDDQEWPSNRNTSSVPRVTERVAEPTATQPKASVAVAPTPILVPASGQKAGLMRVASKATHRSEHFPNINPNENLCAGLVSHTKGVPVKRVKKPPHMKYYLDPAFGTKNIRITDSRQGEVFKPVYSTIQAWNADESLLMLYRKDSSGSRHVLLDGTTYKPVKELNIFPSDIEEVFWSHNNPDVFYFVNKYSQGIGELREYNVRTDSINLIKDFSQQCGAGVMPNGGGDAHMQSLDDDLFGFRCGHKKTGFKMISYRRSTDTVITKPIGKAKSQFHEWYAPMPGPSGNRFWFQGYALNTDLDVASKRMDMAKNNEHSNVGVTYQGQDALFQTGFDPSPKGCNGDKDKGVGHIVEHNLETGKCRNVMSEADGWPYTTSSTHISARAIHRPGWLAMSSVGYQRDYGFFESQKKAPALFSEIYLVNTDPKNETVCRLAQHRSFGKIAENGGYTSYFGEPHATISPSGTRIIYASDWYDSGSVDSYVLELPSYRK